MYEMFLGPIEQSKPWNTNGIEGVYKFLNRFWSLFFNNNSLKISNERPSKEEFKILHIAIKKIKEDIERLSLNTCISQLMITVNSLSKINCNKKEILEPLTIIISPFAPHICEELWSQLNNKESISFARYPNFNKDYLIENEYEYPIMINGKLRAKKLFNLDLNKSEIEKRVLEIENVKKWVSKNDVKKIIIVPNKIINIVS